MSNIIILTINNSEEKVPEQFHSFKKDVNVENLSRNQMIAASYKCMRSIVRLTNEQQNKVVVNFTPKTLYEEIFKEELKTTLKMFSCSVTITFM